MRGRSLVVLVAVLALGAVAGPAVPSSGSPLRFAVSVDPSVAGGPLDGRVFVLVSRSASPEPRLLTDVVDGIPFWGRDVDGLAPGQAAVLDTGPEVYGYPLPSLAELPAGDYWIQGFLNVYTTFHRSDGSVVKLHLPCGDGADFWDSPGNLTGPVRHVQLDPLSSGTVSLGLDRMIEPSDPVPPGGTCQQGNPADSAHVKHVKIRSPLLSAFWGRPMYLGANVLLPEGYDPSGETRYPVIWRQTHFPFGNPFGFSESLSNDFSAFWVSGAAPRVLVVDIRHENPYYDDSYAVNSANLGPYGDAITTELMPYVERRFHAIGRSWARVTTGGSTGGWEAIAQQVFYPSRYGGAWIFYPDPVDFRSFQLVNIYGDPNAYVHPHPWIDEPRPSARQTSGDTIWTMGDENHWELAMGTHGRSQLGQWDIWQAVYGPQGADGYPAPIWDKLTGAIDHGVARQWRPMDLRDHLAANWAALGPQLRGKLHLFVGDDDTYFLNDAVKLLQQFLQGVANPPADATFRYGHDQPHGWSPYTTSQLVTILAQWMAGHAPAGTATSAWLPPAATAPVAGGSHVSGSEAGRRGAAAGLG